MRKLTYWICFSTVAFASIYAHAAMALMTSGIYWPTLTLLSPLSAFGTITPGVLTPFVPSSLIAVLNIIVLALVIHRLYMLLVKRQGVPETYAGLAKFFGYVGAWSITLAVVTLALSIALSAGSGVPAGMLLIPAVFCAPWAIFLAEVLSFRKSQGRD